MSAQDAAELARRLARNAEGVCKRYLAAGRREGNYWIVGDVHNQPGRSMYVRLKGPDEGRGAAGKWTDAATGEHGDLLDVIREIGRCSTFREAAEEARRFLSLPRPESSPPNFCFRQAPTCSSLAARRLFAIAQPIKGTLAEHYLEGRSITALHETASLRFHPRCYYRPDERSRTEIWPALVAAVTDPHGAITGVHRTWLDPKGFNSSTLGKAPIAKPRKAIGDLLGHAVRFGAAGVIVAAGEGIETILSLRCALPSMPMVAALSAAHLAAYAFPPELRKLYVARDNDAAGQRAASVLVERAEGAGIDVSVLAPLRGDFNEDLRNLGLDALRIALLVQAPLHDLTRYFEMTV